MEFLTRCYNPYRPPTKLCVRCGLPALHQCRRDSFVEELCCSCIEQITGEACMGHEVAGGQGTETRIHILSVNDEQMTEIFNIAACSLHGMCIPPCLQDSGAYGCCRFCDPEIPCSDRCEL